MIDELKQGIEVSKNILDTLPKNNIKNKNKYKSTLEVTKYNYDVILNGIVKEINKRKDKFSKVFIDETIEDDKKQIKYIKDNLFLLNKYNTSYEKFGFDKILYELNHFYKDDLNKTNSNILQCITLFKNAGINLEASDFNYSQYANKYMEVLLQSIDDSEKIKQTFETLYWQCPDLIKHIELNFKYLYYKNQNTFEQYASLLKDDFVKKYSDNVLKVYRNLVLKYNDNISNSLYIYLNKFLNKELNISDYDISKVEKYYGMFTDNYKDNFDKVNEEIRKFSLSNVEYKNYLYFNYIIDDLKKIYKEKDSYKNSLKNKLKLISKKEKTLFLFNKKSKGKEKINIKISNLINELEVLYKELDSDIFNDKVYLYLDEDSSIYDILSLACSHYLYIVKCMIKYEKEGSFKEEQDKLIEFLLSPYNNIITNIAISEEKDLPLIISDRYKLSNIKITKENLLVLDNINEIINIANKIEIYNKIVLKLSYDNIKFLIDAKDILKK